MALAMLKPSAKSLKLLAAVHHVSVVEPLALADSGSTHHVRPPFDGEDISSYPSVKVELATGEGVLRLSPGGVLIGSQGC